MNTVMIERKMKNKIESLIEFNECAYLVKFIDIDDTFWFNNRDELQLFLNIVSHERYANNELRKGYFLYTNENGETFKYHVKNNRGSLTVFNEEFCY